MNKFLLTCAILAFSSSAISAATDYTQYYNFQVDGIYYKTLDSTAKTVSVSYNPDSKYTDSKITINETVTHNKNTYTVTGIANSAFNGCTNLQEISIPNSVTTIGYKAFYGCTSLESITIPNSVTTIEPSAFYNCSNLQTAELPNSITTIKSSLFIGCSKLASITIPNSVTYIYSSVFSKCTSLTSVTIPNSVTQISSSTFKGCTGLKSVTIYSYHDQSRQVAANGAIRRIDSDKSLSIESSVFSGCTALEDIYLATDYVPTVTATTFDYSNNKININLHVNPGLAEDFSKAEVWKDFTTLTQTGIIDVNEDECNAEIEYFNLQGVKVTDPSTPGLYIKRQGSAVSKVLIK